MKQNTDSYESRLKRIFNNMFGFIFSQPIHVTLRQMRFITVGVIINSQMLLWYICDIMLQLDSTQAAIGLSAAMLAEVAAIWKCVDSFSSAIKKDEVHMSDNGTANDTGGAETQGSTQTPPKKTEE